METGSRLSDSQVLRLFLIHPPLVARPELTAAIHPALHYPKAFRAWRRSAFCIYSLLSDPDCLRRSTPLCITQMPPVAARPGFFICPLLKASFQRCQIKKPRTSCEAFVARPGFEPRQTEPKSVVLPLYYRAVHKHHRKECKSKGFYPFPQMKMPIIHYFSFENIFAGNVCIFLLTQGPYLKKVT